MTQDSKRAPTRGPVTAEEMLAGVFVQAWDQHIGQDGAIAIIREIPLIAEAINVATETGMGPRALSDELAATKSAYSLLTGLLETTSHTEAALIAQRQELVEALAAIMEAWNSDNNWPDAVAKVIGKGRIALSRIEGEKS